MLSRRSLLAVSATSFFARPILVHAQPAGGSSETDIETSITTWANDPSNQDYFAVPGQPGRGSKILPPDDSRVREAARLLASAKSSGPPIDVAKDLIDRLPASWRMEWPRDKPNNPQPANPLIVGFFASTNTFPFGGDETAWCAAFMCWAIERAGLESPNSSGSRAFRSWGTPVKNPDIGDVVCFRNTKDPLYGHVGFFDGYTDDTKSAVFLVGGNQGDMLKRASFKLSGGTLALHSFRTVEGLHA